MDDAATTPEETANEYELEPGTTTTPGGAEPRTISRPADLPGAPMSSTLAFDAPCRRCGYNLRGLTLGTVCPECRGAVSLSLRGDRLVFAPPEHVGRLARGSRLVALGVGLYVASMVLVMTVSISLAWGGQSGQVSVIYRWFSILSGLIPLGCAALLAVGWWIMTSPDPGRLEGSRDSRSRLWARWSLAAMVLASVSMFALSAIAPGGGAPGAGPFVILPALLLMALWLAHYYAGLVYTRGLIRRSPPSRLMGVTTLLLWAPVAYVGSLFAGALCLPIILGSVLFMLVCVVFYVALYARLTLLLRTTRRQSEQLWFGDLDPARLVEGDAPLAAPPPGHA